MSYVITCLHLCKRNSIFREDFRIPHKFTSYNQQTSTLAIPPFTPSGLLPQGIHDCTLDELRERFVVEISSDIRTILWGNLQTFIQEVRNLGFVSVIYVDGGFTTDKVTTKDIDVALEFPPIAQVSADATLAQQVTPFIMGWTQWHNDVQQRLQIDAYFDIDIGNSFSLFFQYIKSEDALKKGLTPNDRKGILRIAI